MYILYLYLVYKLVKPYNIEYLVRKIKGKLSMFIIDWKYFNFYRNEWNEWNEIIPKWLD